MTLVQHRVLDVLRLLLAAAIPASFAAPESARAQSPPPAQEESYAPPAALSDANPDVRASAIRALVGQGETRAMGKIAALARKDPDPEVRAVAAWAVGEMDLKMRKSLLRSLAEEDPSAQVRREAERSLGKLEKAPATPAPAGAVTGAASAGAGPERAVQTDGTIVVCAEKPPATTGFAWGAGVFGFLGTGGVGALYISAAVKKDDLVPAIPLAAAGTGLTVITAVIVGVGSKSARGQPGVDGSIGLRLFGWLTFGFHIIGSAVLAGAVPFHWIKEDDAGNKWTPPMGWIIANGATAMVSIVALSADSLVAASQAQTLVEEERSHTRRGVPVSIAPFVAPYATSGFGTSGAVLGVVGTM
jgi:hypothetical protein